MGRKTKQKKLNRKEGLKCVEHMSAKSRETLVYKRDDSGHLLCERCGFKPKATVTHPFGNPSTMHYHMKKHINDFPYECSICKSGFPQKQNLVNHMKARHPDHLKEKENMFKCPINGCKFQSITKGNCLIHCARRHYSDLVESHLEISLDGAGKVYHCSCCSAKEYKNATGFYHHILKCLITFGHMNNDEVESLV